MSKVIKALALIFNPAGLRALWHLLELTRDASRDKQLSQEESDQLHAAVWDVVEAYRKR